MPENKMHRVDAKRFPLVWVCLALTGVGLAAFVAGLLGDHPKHAWQAYLINFLLWSAIAQGAVLFSAVMHMTNARWSGPLSGLSESFAAFFPISFVLFLILFIWAVKSGQYDDTYTPSIRILFDDEEEEEEKDTKSPPDN